jgi:hypothetical protein
MGIRTKNEIDIIYRKYHTCHEKSKNEIWGICIKFEIIIFMSS